MCVRARACVCEQKAKMEEFKCYFVGSRTSTAGNDGLYLRKSKTPKKANMLQKNIMRTKASSKAERSTGWTGKWPLVLQQTN